MFAFSLALPPPNHVVALHFNHFDCNIVLIFIFPLLKICCPQLCNQFFFCLLPVLVSFYHHTHHPLSYFSLPPPFLWFSAKRSFLIFPQTLYFQVPSPISVFPLLFPPTTPPLILSLFPFFFCAPPSLIFLLIFDLYPSRTDFRRVLSFSHCPLFVYSLFFRPLRSPFWGFLSYFPRNLFYFLPSNPGGLV